MKLLLRSLLASILALLLYPAQAKDDVLLRAASEELERAKKLQFPALAAPYYIEYAVDDALSFSLAASLGGIVTLRTNRFRVPRIQVRVGTPALDNTNFVLSDTISGSLPVDDHLLALRHSFWLATDTAYKNAVEVFARKRAAITNFVNPERLDDFSRAAPTVKVLPAGFRKVDESRWVSRIRAVSAVFAAYPKVLTSSVELEIGQSYAYMVNSEGSKLRLPDHLSHIRIRAAGLAGDGSVVRDAALFQAADPESLPGESELRAAAVRVAENVTALAAAEPGADYTGPVLFEATAAAQLLAQLLGRNLAIPRAPVSFPGRPAPVLESELDGRLHSRILPEHITVVDDPTLKEWKGRPLLGHYEVDLEGVVPGPLRVVDRGVLEAYLLTRQPVRGGGPSNGRARLPGAFGAKAALISNLIVTSSQPAPAAEMKKRLLDLAQKRKLDYGLLIRKLDFPSTASLDELRRLSASLAKAGSARAVSAPLLVYRVHPDGREEPVRNLRFKDLSVRVLRDIVAVSGDPQLFDFVNSTAPMALVGGANYVAGSAVVAPSMLFEELQLERPKEQLPKPPLVPPPPLAALK
jgi:predicted Zn-dependent protease